MASRSPRNLPSSPRNLLWAIAASLFERRRVLLAGLVLAGLAWVGGGAWRLHQGPLRSNPRFQITAQSVRITEPPAWVRVDIRAHAIDRARLQGPLTVIDPDQAAPRIAEAFRLEPWVKKVNRVELEAPNRVTVNLQWRRPLAVVQYTTPQGAALLPLDPESVRLPPAGLAEGELRRMPRITHIHTAPPIGEAWLDPQVTGAVRLIQQLGVEWSRLSLADVAPSQLPEIRGEQQFYQFELLTIGGTRIVWGAAPGVPCDEPAFDVKLARLKQFVAQHNVELDNYNSPETIDLRQGLQDTKRIAKKRGDKRTAHLESETSGDEELVK